MSWLVKLRASFGKARDSLAGVQALGRARKPITPELWEELEESACCWQISACRLPRRSSAD